MSASYKQRLAKQRKAWSRNAVAAKARKRMEQADAMRDMGGITTDGCLGQHAIRLLAYPHDGRMVAVVVDGQHRRPRTLRGVWRAVGKMIWNNK